MPDTGRLSLAFLRDSCFRAALKSSTISVVISSRYFPLKNLLSVLQFHPWSAQVFGLCCCFDHSRNCSTYSSNFGASLAFVNPARRSSKSAFLLASHRNAAVLFVKPVDS